MKSKISVAFIALLINSFTLNAQTDNSDAHITGHVVDKQTDEHILFATVAIKGTALGTTTNNSGHYNLSNIPVGTYTIAASYVGYETQEIEITLEKGKTIVVDFELKETYHILNEVVVTASRQETKRSEAVTIVNVLTPKIFEMTNSVCLAEGLNFQPGLRIENNCQNCGFPQLRINGLEGPYTQILVDSRAINSALAGVYGLEHIPVNMVERVEVVRGGASALYGSSAVGGIVNIITKEPKYNSLTVSNTNSYIYGTSPDISTNLNASIVSENNRTGVTLFASSRQRDPFDYDNDGFSEIGKMNMKSIGFRGFHRINSNNRLTLEYHAIDEFRRGGNNFKRPPHEADIAEQTEHVIHSGGFKYDIFFNEKNSLQLYSSLQSIQRQSYYGTGQDPDAYGDTEDLSLVSGSQYTLRMDRLLFMPSTFITGVEYSHNALKDEMLGYDRIIDQKVGIYSVYAQNEWRNERASLLFGGRYDKHSMISDPIISPRISGRFAPLPWMNLRAGFATGYRGPQAYDEDLHVTAVGQGVALIRLAEDLQPEKSKSFNFSTELSKATPSMSFLFLAEGFYTQLNHVFLLEETGKDADGNLMLERRNGSGARVAGVNLEASMITIKDFQVSAGFTIQSSMYKEPEQWSESVEPQRKMFRAPSNYGYVTVASPLAKQLQIALSGVYTGSMLVQHFAGYIPEDTEMKTPNFFDLNFKIDYDFNLNENVSLRLSAGMQNIFNSYQKDFDQGEFRDAGYIYGPTLPRTVFFGMKLML